MFTAKKGYSKSKKKTMYTLDKSALDELSKEIIEAGIFAKRMQNEIHRSFKSDGSVLTETDLAISKRIEEDVARLFPDCGFISEEAEIVKKEDAKYTFILDPIDGTDVYSQGLPSFAISLGIIDSNREPVGAMIYLPRFGRGREDMFVRLDPNGELLVDGKVFTLQDNKDDVKQVTMGSGGQVKMDFSHFEGKVRTFGSSIIHLLSVVVFSAIQGCVNQPCFVWDIVSAHAVLKKVGMDIVYVDGEKFVYTDSFLYEKKKFKKDIYAGTPKAIECMRKILPVRV